MIMAANRPSDARNIMTIFLTFVAISQLVAICVLVILFRKATRALKRFSKIADVEAFKDESEREANAFIAQSKELSSQRDALIEHLKTQKAEALKLQKLLGNLKTAA